MVKSLGVPRTCLLYPEALPSAALTGAVMEYNLVSGVSEPVLRMLSSELVPWKYSGKSNCAWDC